MTASEVQQTIALCAITVPIAIASGISIAVGIRFGETKPFLAGVLGVIVMYAIPMGYYYISR